MKTPRSPVETNRLKIRLSNSRDPQAPTQKLTIGARDGACEVKLRRQPRRDQEGATPSYVGWFINPVKTIASIVVSIMNHSEIGVIYQLTV